jgi:hypothetical protein
MKKWLSLDSAVKLIGDTRKIGEGAAIRFLIDACADGVRSRRYECAILLQVANWRQKAESHSQSFEPSDLDYFSTIIPAAVWRGAHLEMSTGELYPAGTDSINCATEEGGYGHGGSDIIEINEDNLREYLGKPAPQKRGRKPKVGKEIDQKILTLLDHLGAPASGDPKWESQADVARAIQEHVDVADSVANFHARRILNEWLAGKTGKVR